MASRLDGPKERMEDLKKRYDREGGGKNPFYIPVIPVKKAKAKKKKKKRTA